MGEFVIVNVGAEGGRGSQCNPQMNFFCINHRRKCNCFSQNVSPIGGRNVCWGRDDDGNNLLSHLHILLLLSIAIMLFFFFFFCSLASSSRRLQFDTPLGMQDTTLRRRRIVKSKVSSHEPTIHARFWMMHVDMPDVLMRLLVEHRTMNRAT